MKKKKISNEVVKALMTEWVMFTISSTNEENARKQSFNQYIDMVAAFERLTPREKRNTIRRARRKR